jgi:phosphoenolpyruvate carboxykinase (ATP)
MNAETELRNRASEKSNSVVKFVGHLPPRKNVNKLLSNNDSVFFNLNRESLVRHVIERKEAFAAKQGFLFTYTPTESTGRSPRDTYIVKDPKNEKYIDWNSPNNQPMDTDTFENLWQDAILELKHKDHIYVTDRVIGAEPSFALPVRTISNSALTILFTLNMFRPVPDNIRDSVLADKPFILLVLLGSKVESGQYHGQLQRLANGKTSNMAIVIDFERRLGLIYGSAYGGSVKKLMFTAMNYYLPFVDVLPMHCSANENAKGDLGLFLGLSGTGKTSLSTDPERALLGDDEHRWSERGIANFENGCYAKLIHLNPLKEPEIFRAVFHKDQCTKHGTIVENAMVFPDGSFDLGDDRLTPNSRASYPLSFLRNYKQSATGPHPKTVIFLTADANGVLAPISRLETDQAMLWFLMGYTSKLAGTEAGVIHPESIFSRFFGEPFIPLLPHLYMELFGKKLIDHQTAIFLINTGWIGGPYGIGQRIDIELTRRMVNAALKGELDTVDYRRDQLFHLQVPKSCPGIPSDLLIAKRTWVDSKLYEKRATSLTREFSRHFDKTFGNQQIPENIKRQCPGK